MEVVPNQTVDHKESSSPPAYSNAAPQQQNAYYGNPSNIQPDHQTFNQQHTGQTPMSPQSTGQSYYAGSPPPQQHSGFAPPQHQQTGYAQPQHQQSSPPPMQQAMHSPPPTHQGAPMPQPVQQQGTRMVSGQAPLAAQPIALLTSAPAPVQCPSCGATSITRTQFITGMTTHAWAAGLCLVFCLGCIPYCISGTKDVEQKCGNCGVLLGTWHRSGRFEQHMYPSQQQAIQQQQQQLPMQNMQPMQQAYYGGGQPQQMPAHQGGYQ